MKEYVVGFYFTQDSDNVLLIKKINPAWQRGLLNGIGGHVESGEHHWDAMVREFQEETGIHVETWRYLTTLHSLLTPAPTKGTEPFKLHAYATRGPLFMPSVFTPEGEVGWYHLWRDVPLGSFDCVWNLRWLIPLGYELLSEPSWSLSQSA